MVELCEVAQSSAGAKVKLKVKYWKVKYIHVGGLPCPGVCAACSKLSGLLAAVLGCFPLMKLTCVWSC